MALTLPNLLNRSPASTTAAGVEDRELLDIGTWTAEDVFKKLNVTDKGLTLGEVQVRRVQYGANEVSRGRRYGFVADFAGRLINPLVVLLLVIAGISLVMGDIRAAIVVGVMILLSVVLGYYQEFRSGQAVEKLRSMVQTTCTVIRDGKEIEIAIVEVVPGDVVTLAAGSMIPADVRLTSAKDFYVSQSTLTGESMPVEKHGNPLTGVTRALELLNVCFQGSSVVSGTARGIVVRTGEKTCFGSITRRLSGQRVLTSFEKGINGFTWLMIRFMVVMVSAVFLINTFSKGNWVEALLFSLAVALGLTPEMLPMIVTVNLSKGALAMSRKKVIVKRLNSIQNFGAMDTLCTDKTGTLTQDKVVLERHVDVTNKESDDVLRYAYMNSYFQTGLRNLLDRAILSHSDLDVDRNCRKVDEIPFDFSRRRMSVIVDYEGDHVLICKGAVQDMFPACTHYQIDDEIYPLVDMLKTDIMEEYVDLSNDGFRVLAIAYREFPQSQREFSMKDESGLTLLGYIAFYDPPKDSAAQALVALQQLGVGIKILTGDNEFVTRKVCKDVGLSVEHIMTGDQLIGLSPEELTRAAQTTTVFARLTPAQKDGIILALQRGGHVVGFLGDGINDAPAMKTADVGISVDTAAEVAKESADIILLEKSLLVLEDGVLEGRQVFGNIVKYIKMASSSNFGNMFSVVGASFLLPFLPMAPLQIMVNNLLYDFSQVGIPTDQVDPEYLIKPRRWNIEGIKKFMMFVGPVSSIFDYATFALMWYFFGASAYAHVGASAATKAYSVHLFQTGWFVESLLTQTLIVHIIRTNRVPFFQSRASVLLTLTTLTVVTISVLIPYLPIGRYLDFVPLPGTYWLWISGMMILYATLTHMVKTWFVSKYGTD
jgi:Mg2+-importing ATPase